MSKRVLTLLINLFYDMDSRGINKMAFITSISKSYTHNGKNIKHRSNTPKRWFAYGFDFDNKFIRVQISPIQAILYKGKISRIKRYFCVRCGLKFANIESPNPICPICENQQA